MWCKINFICTKRQNTIPKRENNKPKQTKKHLENFCRNNPDAFRILEEPISTEQYAIAFKLGNEALRDKVQETYDEMLADGTVMKIAEKYSDDNLPDMLITE